jgi:putative transposase
MLLMKLTAKVKLVTGPIQSRALLDTLDKANQACNWISEQAWAEHKFRQFDMQKTAYYPVRERFGLSAQVVIRCLTKVADAYRSAFALHKERTAEVKRLNKKLSKLAKEPKPLPIMQMVQFGSTGAIAYDSRILRWWVNDQKVSLWTTSGRLKVPFQAGPKQLELLQSQQGESDLIYHKGEFYLAATCNVDEPPQTDVDTFLGVDFGVTNISSDSDGKKYSGSTVKSVRFRHRRMRCNLQRKGTRAAKRRLKKLAGQEARFAKHTNHVISKEIVASAKGTNRGMKLEDLSGIRDRITVRRKQRVILHSWAFFQLASFVSYKAQRSGVPLVFVDPRNTSRECSRCGHIAKENRPNQSTFRCLACNHAENADTNAARVIAGRPACNPGEGDNVRLSGSCRNLHGPVKSPRL